MSQESFRERFWDVICEYESFVKLALAIDVTILLLLLIAAQGIRPGTAAYVILVVDFAILAPLLAVTLFVLWRCSHFQPGTRF
ncbi:MAG: hypothetical protein ABEJ42_07780 [Halobacteriaceae archaeon]